MFEWGGTAGLSGGLGGVLSLWGLVVLANWRRLGTARRPADIRAQPLDLKDWGGANNANSWIAGGLPLWLCAAALGLICFVIGI